MSIGNGEGRGSAAASVTDSDRIIAWGMYVLVGVQTAWAMTEPLRKHETWLNFVQDDFFYYLKVAQEMAAGHGSTSNGLVPTNGYHPLWFLMMFAVERMGGGMAGAAVFVAVTTWLATMATLALCLRILRRGGVSLAWSALFGAVVAVFGMHLYQKGMEGTLATPLMLWLLCALQNTTWWQAAGRAGVWRAFLVGLLVTAMVLARLDSLIFAGLLGLGIAFTPKLRSQLRARQLAALAAGLLPLAIYFAVNHGAFGTWMPVSGMAKQLKIDHGFTSMPGRTVLEQPAGQWVYVVPVLLAVAVLPRVWKRLLSYVSDWPIWYWYYYPLRPALCVAFVVLLRLAPVAHAARWKPLLVAAALLIVARVATTHWDEQVVANTDAALHLQQFARTHSGIYAMGDRAGAAGLLLPYPLVQTEGLMMDKAFLGKLQAQRPLREVLAEYHVRYFVGTAVGSYPGCFEAYEPAQGGGHAAKMHGTFCEQPVARWWYGNLQTMVFDVGR